MPEHELGRYTGRLVLEPLPDGRRMRVLEHFGFMEADGLHWAVKPLTKVDGASIPQVLWSLMGGPFEGKYRNASVVHDYYCDVRSADWRSVHRMFYRAMLVSGVSVRRAKVMYAAVYFAGPKWSDTVVENVNNGTPAVPTLRPDSQLDLFRIKEQLNAQIMFSVRHDPTTVAVSEMLERDGHPAATWATSPGSSAGADSDVILKLDKLYELVEREEPSLRTLEAAIDGALTFVEDADDSARSISIGDLPADLN
jgi:Protein of unknown function (DUF1353)